MLKLASGKNDISGHPGEGDARRYVDNIGWILARHRGELQLTSSGEATYFYPRCGTSETLGHWGHEGFTRVISVSRGINRIAENWRQRSN